MPLSRMDSILLYWFEGVDDTTAINTNDLPFKKWFAVDEEIDREILREFEPDLLKAAQGNCKDWENSAKGMLALVILYDQFSRNMYRGTDKMYAFDPPALALTLRALEEGKDRELMLIERAFLYLPLMHSENIKMQQLSLDRYIKLVEKSKMKNPGNTQYYQINLKYARDHHKTVAQFGRFPHRDAILKRAAK